ncbi:hypothetical protein [Salana multivorans]
MTGATPTPRPRTCTLYRVRPGHPAALPAPGAGWPATLAEHLARVPAASLPLAALAWLLDAATDPARTEAEVAATVREHAATFVAEWDRRHGHPGGWRAAAVVPGLPRPLPGDDLAALPPGSVVLDGRGIAWQAGPPPRWAEPGSAPGPWWRSPAEGDAAPVPSDELAADGPFTLLHVPRGER